MTLDRISMCKKDGWMPGNNTGTVLANTHITDDKKNKTTVVTKYQYSEHQQLTSHTTSLTYRESQRERERQSFAVLITGRSFEGRLHPEAKPLTDRHPAICGKCTFILRSFASLTQLL